MGAPSGDAGGALLLANVAGLVVVARLVAATFRRYGQPAVVGEIVAGILLGPSLLGLLPGGLAERLLPAALRPELGAVAQIGLLVFMFGVGVEIDLGSLRTARRSVPIISASSIVLPFGLGTGLGFALYPAYGPATGAVRLPFALFLGTAMSITALPVLARILQERGLHRERVGAMALSCAAVDDVVAWCLLALVQLVAVSAGPGPLLRTVVASVAYAVLMLTAGRAALRRLARRSGQGGRLAPDLAALLFAGALASAWVTSRIGIHAIFGAFLFGMAVPRDAIAAPLREVAGRLDALGAVLLSLFFVLAGLRVDLGELHGSGVLLAGAVLLVACAGKFAGAFLPATALGFPPREAATLAVLVNARGLTEIVVLDVGLSMGVLDVRLYSAMVLMALATTAMTGPLVRLLRTAVVPALPAPAPLPAVS